MMLPAKNRLKKADFRVICQKGKAVHFQDLSLKMKANDCLFSRVGFSISGKLFAGAVQRNKIKRILRETLRFHLKNIKPGYDTVIFYKKPKSSNGAFKAETLKKQLENLLKTSGLLKI